MQTHDKAVYETFMLSDVVLHMKEMQHSVVIRAIRFTMLGRPPLLRDGQILPRMCDPHVRLVFLAGTDANHS